MSHSEGGAAGLELAHVLFMDLVGFSLLTLQEQTALVAELQELVRGTAEFQRAEAAEELIRLPVGDGMALVFFRDPTAPVRCAMAISLQLRAHARIQLRMGIHSGPVRRVVDINGNVNVTGRGINLAQRAMDAGDAGHILLSGTMADLLDQMGGWELDDLGEFEIKHGERLRLFNLHGQGIGRAELPEGLTETTIAETPATDATSARVTEAAGTVRIAVLYKRHAQPDEDILEFLETELKARGCEVFIDRHMAVGVEWARELEQQLRSADAVIPLISLEALPSEMLAWEVQLAREAADEQDGKPRILPVRVAYEGPLPEPLAGILDPIEYALWQSPDDNDRLVDELLIALRAPQEHPQEREALVAPTFMPTELEAVGGAVPLDSKFYVARPIDQEFYRAIDRRDSIVLVKGARQMGKTSLLARGLQRARDTDAGVVLTDFQKLNTAHLESVEAFFLTLADSLADQLDLDVLPDDVWNARRGPNMNFERYIRREVLRKLDGNLIWGLDEVDRLFSCPFSSEVFGLFRSWHNERSLDPSGPWSHLTLAIAYATEAHLFITDINQSPFNVGTRLTLEDFTFEQVSELNERHGSPLQGQADVARYFRLVGGQPYLVRRGLSRIVTESADIDDLVAQAPRDEGPFGDHLRRFLVLLAQDEALCDVVRAVLRGQPCADAESFYRLRSAGLFAGDGPRDARPRCQVYATYLEQHLL